MEETTQMDSTQVEQPIQVEIIDDVVDAPQQVEQEVATQEEGQAPTTPEQITIDGKAYSLDEIKEFQRGYMRQQDYTRKTQELASMRKQFQEPSVPTVPNGMPPVQDPVMQRINSLEQNIATQQLDMQITMLKTKYPDFDETKVLNEAYERGITDLEFVYKATKEVQQPSTEEIEKQIRAKIMAELEANKSATSTIISNTNTTPPVKTVKLTRAEAEMAKNFGMTPEEYAKWR